MPIEMPRGLPFSVDTWTPNSSRKRHHFLTHAHKDHLSGIAAHSSYPIYATGITKSLLLRHLPHIDDESVFVEVEVGESAVVHDPDGAFSVTAFDANHCPGAVMFLFEGEFGNVLHTGDCRFSSDCLQNLPLNYITKNGKETLCRLDYLFLDCTFGRCSLAMPSKQSAIQQVIKCIWKHPNAPVVYLACDLLGQEEILVEVSKTFGSKIFVDKSINAECFQALMLLAPEILSEDASSRFQVFGYARLYERASMKLTEARASMQPEPLFIRPSAQWYACDEISGTQGQSKPDLSEAVRDEFGVWHTCYSMHSSREELESALQLLQPKWVISTTPPCWAMELDYVKRHCFQTQVNSDDPIWKLLKFGTDRASSVTSTVLKRNVNASAAVVLKMPTVTERSQLQLMESTVNSLEVHLDSSVIERPITLFGRARLGLQDQNVLHSESSIPNTMEKLAASLQEDTVSCQLLSSETANIAGPVSCLQDDNAKECHLENSSNGEIEIEKAYIGSSTCLNASLRKLYRSMNVPVPRPLPSLTKLMDASKRVRIRY